MPIEIASYGEQTSMEGSVLGGVEYMRIISSSRLSAGAGKLSMSANMSLQHNQLQQHLPVDNVIGKRKRMFNKKTSNGNK
ncbi:hypothetical protein PIB30_024437 [Stylosanthes scabra]|uniref:Uncharacterized protein n=1 Tax=Stylosanthes scabra TaxID=79078 RepID=A0ABU6W9D1_9FABA|nr:hypothetical protein [Stylosanthes scabra]